MKYRVIQHIPAFIDTDEPRKEATVDKPEDALNLDWIKAFEGKDYVVGKPYLTPDGDYVMVEEAGNKRWVVAIIRRVQDEGPICSWLTWAETKKGWSFMMTCQSKATEFQGSRIPENCPHCGLPVIYL